MSSSNPLKPGQSLLAMNEEILLIVRGVERRLATIKQMQAEVDDLLKQALALDGTIEALRSAGVRNG